MANKPRRCWDSDACFGFLVNQNNRAEECERVLREAEEDRCEIVVSALALAEVLYLRTDGPQKLYRESRDKIRAFFRRSYFVVVDVDRFIAEQAQELFWEYNPKVGLAPKDAIHVATALNQNAVYLETYDTNLLRLSGKVGGDPPLMIQTPGDDLKPLAGGIESTGQRRLGPPEA